jgi:hypothetical protein
VIIKSNSRTLDDQTLDQTLKNAKAPIATAIAAKSLGTIQLCRTDASLNITRRETESGVSDGWSRVAAKSAASRRPLVQTASSNNNLFSALAGGNKVTFAKKKEKKPIVPVEPVVEDWEAAEMAEEEKEKLASGHNSGAEDEAATVESSSTVGVESLETVDGIGAVDAPVTEIVPEAATVIEDTQTEVDAAAPEAFISVDSEQAKEVETA